MQSRQPRSQEIAALEAHAIRALQAGREDEALSFWKRILDRDPWHPHLTPRERA